MKKPVKFAVLTSVLREVIKTVSNANSHNFKKKHDRKHKT
jgi:hypothetical protein